MAKQRRAQPRPAPPKRRRSSAWSRSAPLPALASGPPRSAPPARPSVPALRTTYVEAVALYARGLQALQAHDYVRATDLFRSVIARYPEEKELHERVRLYLNICERQVAPRPVSVPSSIEERLYAATLALNAGKYEQALSHIQAVIGEEPDNDHAHYVRAVVLTLSGNLADAVPSLIRAIELNPENRSLARQDPDLEALRVDDRFRQTLDILQPAPRQDKRRPTRGRFTR